MKKTTKRLLFPIFMATIIFTAACSAKTDTDNKKAPASGATKSDTQQKTQEKDSDNIKLKTLSGYEMDSKSLFTQSELTVINVWNSSCTSCEKEMGILESLSQEYAGRGVQILGLIQGVTDVKDADSLAVVNSAGINYTQLLDSEEFSQLYLKNLGPLPSSIFIDRKGNVLGQMESGSQDALQWKSEIENYHQKVCVGDHPADSSFG